MQCKSGRNCVFSIQYGMATYLRHLRPVNLILLLLIQAWLYVYIGYYHGFGFTPYIPLFVSFTLVLIGACGYLINDYYDIATDIANMRASHIQRNHPRRLLLVFWMLAGASFCLALMIAWRLQNFQWLILHPVSLVGLWYYSFRLKCTPLVGNLWVSVFAAAVFVLPFLTIFLMQGHWYIDSTIKWFILSSFCLTLYREIIKDIEDIKGDQASGCSTFPVIFGYRKSKHAALIFAMLGFITLVIWVLISQKILFQIALTFILLIHIYTIILLLKASESVHFGKISSILKVIMYAGALLLMIS